MRLVHLLELLKSLDHPSLERCIVHSALESVHRDIEKLHLMPSLLLDSALESSFTCDLTTPTANNLLNKGSVANLLGHGSKNKILDEPAQSTDSAMGPERGPRLQPEHRNHLALDEEKRKRIKELVSLLENLWKSISMGATLIPIGTMQVFCERIFMYKIC